MTGKEYVVYDFKKAGASDDTAYAFKSWISKSAQLFATNWARIAIGEAVLGSGEIRTQSFGSVIESAPSTSVCCLKEIDNGRIISLWYVNQECMKLLVAEMLGQPEDAEINEKLLTEIELSLGKLFFDCLIQSISESWLGPQSLDCKLTGIELNPKQLRLFRTKDLVTVTSLTVKLNRGEATVHWILPKQEITELLEVFVDRRKATRSKNSPIEVVEQLPIEMVCLLGEANLSMRNLSQLTVGDVVILDQKIDKPIVVTIDGRPYYECWPGKLGDQQGLEIAKCS